MKGRVRSLLGRGRPAPGQPSIPRSFAELNRLGEAMLVPSPVYATAQPRLAVIVPSFRRGSGGHMTIVNLMLELQALGLDVSLWLEDCEGRHAVESAEMTRRSFAEFFSGESLPFHTGFEAWDGADVVMATGWQTVARALLLAGVSRRVYLVQDHEPDFYPASAERLFAEDTYRKGLHCIAASEWLAELLRTRYGASATHFDLAVDHDLYNPGAGARSRRKDLVVFYARAVTPRRAVPLGLMALEQLAERRPDVEIALFGEDRPLDAPFKHTNLGVLPAAELAELYRRATAGMVFSLTNPSLIGLEMMACGLPCVELASESMVASFGRKGPLKLTAADPSELSANLCFLLDNTAARASHSHTGFMTTAQRTWSGAAQAVIDAVRIA